MKHVCLEIYGGCLEQHSFKGRLLLGTESQVDAYGVYPVEFPAMPHLPHRYRQWRDAYHGYAKNTRLGASGNQITNIGTQQPTLLKEVRQNYTDLVTTLGTWLHNTRISYLCEEQINEQTSLSKEQTSFFGLGNFILPPPMNEIHRISVQTDFVELWHYPWHDWTPIRQHSNLDVVFSPMVYQSLKSSTAHHEGVRILAIFGASGDLDLKGDLEALRALPNVELHCLRSPQLSELYSLWCQPWDILFFAGHSQGNGIIINNEEEPLQIYRLYETLKTAVAQGLKLAIFNSCDSIPLGQFLIQLGLPHAIVMREAVPNIAAELFLKYFLQNFHGGADLYAAVAQARSQLRELSCCDDHLPGTSALPLICRHPQARCPHWHHLRRSEAPAVTVGVSGGDRSSPRVSKFPAFLYWCRWQLELAQLLPHAQDPSRWVTAIPGGCSPQRPQQNYQDAFANVAHWVCGLERTIGGFSPQAELAFFFPALEAEARQLLPRISSQQLLPYLESLVVEQRGLPRVRAAFLIAQQYPNVSHLSTAFQVLEDTLRQDTKPQVREELLAECQQFLKELDAKLVRSVWDSTTGERLQQFLQRLLHYPQQSNRLKLAIASVLITAKGRWAVEASNVALEIFRNSSYLEDVILASCCLHQAGVRQWEVVGRLERYLGLATVQSHQIALAGALGIVSPNHPQAIDTLELIIEQQAYDLETLMAAVRALHRISPEHPLVLATLRSLLVKAQETQDILGFYYGLAALDELQQPLTPYISTTVIPWVCQKIAVFKAQEEPYLMAPYTVLWYCSRHIPYQEFANLWQ
ncbi:MULTISPECIES: CHAT domain-containing protein [unclassified Thermosynechococcus]|uniref:CHAT domain-containing protein n=1 Tax=unclassified Thermosynechococcus TaxID=2622553 RepID=UPI0026716A31|nr:MULTISPECIES: CHAT domain-containing protein [unclassified Thermosynechococcus]MDR7922156.1 CHAT domain-containing protein [Thermosynechococcus sp. HY213]WKT80048.1 CHAT domain-containing protein [Thermosynechococcus sp. PP45]WNC23658.1 CHAT domain-containing protein [Thermosynechococcus sp. PP551]WNC26234.1 CHAT domain-containing protein [Thermosynechococcus sp. PP555]WNC28811.1 CHAT domain-containing protein [Thermosynechococcus sp. PKX82]